jgi:hypothetical protein
MDLLINLVNFDPYGPCDHILSFTIGTEPCNFSLAKRSVLLMIYIKAYSRNVKKALLDNGWISKINMEAEFTVEHIRQYIRFWVKLADVSRH